MSYDGIFTHLIVDELKTNIQSGRISKIYQPFPHEIVLTVRANRKNQKLLLSAHPSYARIQLTEEALSNPEQAPNFCMFLRKNIEGAVIEEVEQLGNDRIVRFKMNRFDDLGDLKQLILIVELMGRHSNIFLVDQESNRIMDCLKHVPASQNSFRPIYPGADYLLPPHQDKLNPFSATAVEIDSKWNDLEEAGSPAKGIQTIFQGIGRDSAQEIGFYMEQENVPLVAAMKQFISNVYAGPPALVTQENEKQSFLPYPFQTVQGEVQSFSTPSELLDVYYTDKATRDRIRQVASDLLQLIRNEKQKNETKIKKLQEERVNSERADEYRIKGELLTAYLHQVPKSSKEVTLANFYAEEEPLAISLDPALTASQNAQKYFTKYHKLVNSVKHIEEQLQKTEEENKYLDSIETQIQLSDPQDLEEIRDELSQAGYLKTKRTAKNKKKKISKPYHFRSSDGTDIRVGKNNVQNDELTLKKARKNHIWLHAKDIPGSHVIVEHPEPTEETLLEAAQIAAYYSKFQQSANVPVDYVEVKHVKKPNGAKPGFVIYTDQKTLFVTPTKELVESLRV
ncbi:NFACT RNA binding domain-containing protein [Jeotgalibaca caeni]|uniref:NFACT RNA binding domain-containing protein n=1 Tax=Jeotgalibaca caeni TaxID=3028623 RepID=UPI00237EDA5C|nr:NFACT RNA binding domain-containing protein [Jeotgalibaca caeni]MDE1548793.1 NFACT RNA binding domain-containing protein [Jeotgalibaca caeni]